MSYLVHVFLPLNLNVEELTKKMPTTGIENFKIEKLKFIISEILTIPANNKDLPIEDGFIPVNATILRRKIRNAKQYLDYLVEAGVLECDNRYINGEKSRGYKFAQGYDLLKCEEIDDYFIHNWHHKSKKKKPSQKGYNHLYRWFKKDALKIDFQSAQDFILAEYYRKKDYPELWESHIKWDKVLKKEVVKYKNPLTQYTSSFINISRLAQGDYNPFVDKNVHRFHSNITNLKKELRNFLTYNGEPLVSLDLKNSQPYDSILLLDKDFWSENTSITTKPNYSNYITTTTYPSPIMLSKVFETLDNTDVQLYKELVTNGTLYEFFGEKLFQDYGIEEKDRGKLKTMMFTVLFTGKNNTSLSKKVFKKYFPSVNLIFDTIKNKKKEQLPLMLQRIESELILKRICKRISKERPSVPLYTIHDSVSTTVSNKDYVEQIMLEECIKMIGEKPTILPEYWDSKKITSTSIGENTKFIYEITENKPK